MKFFLTSFLALTLVFSACSSEEPMPVEEKTQVEEVSLSESARMQLVSFASEDLSYLYSFEYDTNLVKYLGYPLEGMSENGGAFRAFDGTEVVTSTSSSANSGMSKKVGEYNVLFSEEKSEDCVLQFRAIPQASETLLFRSKSCGRQDVDLASQVMDMMISSLSVEEL